MNDTITKKQAIIALATSLIVMMLGNFMIFGFEDDRDFKKEVDKKADLEYVKEQDNLIRSDVNKSIEQQNKILDQLIDFRKESQDNFSEIRKQLYKK